MCSDEDDDIVLRSRRRQHGVITPEASEQSEEEKRPGAPEKKRRRILPWTVEGLARWPPVADVVVDEEERSGEDVWVHGQTRGRRVIDLLDLGGDCEEERSGDSETEDNCSDFVVDDDSDSVVEEAEAADRELARGALEEVRVTLAETVERLEVKLSRAKRKLVELDEHRLDCVVPETDVEGDGDVADEACRRTRQEAALEVCYPWECDGVPPSRQTGSR